MSQSQLVVIFIVQDVHQIRIKRMNVVQLWKFLYDLRQFVMKVLLGEFYFPHVKATYSSDLEMLVHNCRGFALCFR